MEMREPNQQHKSDSGTTLSGIKGRRQIKPFKLEGKVNPDMGYINNVRASNSNKNVVVNDSISDVYETEDVREVALKLAMKKENRGYSVDMPVQDLKHIDYVLTYQSTDNGNENPLDILIDLRRRFEQRVKDEGLTVNHKRRGKLVFMIISCSFQRLCQEAEAVSLKMPLANFEAPDGGPVPGCWKHFQTDDEVDLVSAPFCESKREIYEGIEDPDTFFRPSLRSLLVHHILINLNIRPEDNNTKRTWNFHKSSQGLAYMLMHGVYTDALCVHTRSKYDPMLPDNDDEECLRSESNHRGAEMETRESDPRKALNDTWLKWKKFQPVWKIRNYFGEKIALYFAWLGLLVCSLWVPMIIGLVVALWGFAMAVEDTKSSNETLSVGETVQTWLRHSFDNDATPFFALIICLWGTIFLELWKRRTAELAYQWDVSDFEEQEPNRPQFYGTEIQKDPITGKDVWVYPGTKKYRKHAGSFFVILFMVCLVVAATFGIIIYRVVSRVDIFDREGSIGPTLASVTSSFLNTLCIMIMGKCYERLAIKLTDWENHRTQTSYEDALIVKLFAFQFINSYASLYYIAFFRGSTNENGVLDKGPEYSDACGDNNDCMTMLSLQVAMLMIMKPLPKLFSDFILPWLQKLWHNGIRRTCCCCCRDHQIHSSVDLTAEEFIETELRKPKVGNFTLSEYNEKVIQYGFLMLFAAAFPLAPLIALLTNMFDLRMDAKRLLWTNRRPVAFRAEDIGMWYKILKFLNIVGVLTNSFLVAFTSQYGRNWEGDLQNITFSQQLFNNTTNTTLIRETITADNTGRNKLWLVIGFEHIVFAVKFFIAMVIPDVPSHVKMAEMREKYHLNQLLEKAGVSKGPSKKPSENSSIAKKDCQVQTEESGENPVASPAEELCQTTERRPRRRKKRKPVMKEMLEGKITNTDEADTNEFSRPIIRGPQPLPTGYSPALPDLPIITVTGSDPDISVL